MWDVKAISEKRCRGSINWVWFGLNTVKGREVKKLRFVSLSSFKKVFTNKTGKLKLITINVSLKAVWIECINLKINGETMLY